MSAPSSTFPSLCLQYLKLTCALLKTPPEILLISRTLLHVYLSQTPQSSNLVRVATGDNQTALVLTSTIIHLCISLTSPQSMLNVITVILRVKSLILKEDYEVKVKGAGEIISLKGKMMGMQSKVLSSCGFKIPSIHSSPSFYVIILSERLGLEGPVVEDCLKECEALEDEGKHLEGNVEEIARNVLEGRLGVELRL